MKKALTLTIIILCTNVASRSAHFRNNDKGIGVESPEDSVRLAEIDRYWTDLSRTVREGDFEGYSAAYDDRAVIVFATGENKFSAPISTALAGWKQGFLDTKSGKVKSDVKFRFSQRLGNETTAHETGIFHYTSTNNDGEVLADHLVHFEMLLIKREDTWLGLMEYQKSKATVEEWDALK